MNQSEWRDKFISTLLAYRELILTNSSNWSIPKYKINPTPFFSNYKKMLLSRFESLNSNTFLDKIDYCEYRLVNLISCLNTAKEKHERSAKSGLNQFPASNSSQLLRVNQIIKNSFTLTSFIYILKWLQKVYKKDKSLNNDKVDFTNIGNEFHPDLLNQSGTLSEANRAQYEKLMSNINLTIRKGKYAKAQEIAEHKNQFFISSILEGGLAANDFSIDSDELFSQIDFDLFPPYMKNKEFIEMKNAIENKTNLTDVYGNPNWTLWLSSLYESSELCTNDSSLQLNKMSCFLTGSAPLNKSYQEPIDDILYRNILILFNSCLLEEYINDKGAVDYYYSTEGNTKKMIDSRNGKTIIDVLSYIRKTEGFRKLASSDYSLELEFDLIEMHFAINDSPQNRLHYYDLLYTFLYNLNGLCVKGDQINQVLMKNYEDTTQRQNSRNWEVNETRRQDSIYLMKSNYFKMLFVMLISFIGTNGDLIDDDAQSNNELINKIESIYILYNDIISAYCFTLLKITLDPIQIVYITSFLFHLPQSQEILAKLANLINTSQQDYQRLVNEIERHFSSNREEISKFLANKTSIFEFDSSIKTIDMVLEERVMDILNQKGMYILEEDIMKINQLKMLLAEGKINEEILIQYILLLSFNFLAVNKINEVYLMVNDTFSSNFSYEINNNKPIEEFLKELEAFYTQPRYQNDIQSMAIRSLIRLIYQVVHCFFLYADIIYETKKQFSVSSNIFNKSSNYGNNLNEEAITSSLDSLNHLIKLLVTHETMTSFFSEFFGESAYEALFKKIINNWMFQTIKWTCEIKTNDIFLQKKIVTEIDNNLYQMYNLTMINDIMMLNYHIIKKPFGIEDGLNMFKREELLYQFISQENKQEILKLLYKSATRNEGYLKEIFDPKASEALMKDIDKLDF